jgi:hypothetical protein
MDNGIRYDQPVVGYAQPLSRLQVSWGSILAGAISALAVGFLLWLLALAIIFTATNPTVGSIRGSLIAMWITGMVCTLLGALVGGAVAGYLPGNPRRIIAVAHGFLAWCVVFLVVASLQMGVLGGVLRTTTNALVTTATTAVQTTGAVAGGVAGGQLNLDQKAYTFLLSLGYTPDEARRMVSDARRDLLVTLRGPGATSPEAIATQARGAFDTAFAGLATYTWLWFATWALSAGLAAAGASAMVPRVRKVPLKELEREELFGGRPMRPVQHTP